MNLPPGPVNLSPVTPTEQFLSKLSTARRVLITTHVKPDGDALGSSAALALGIRSRGAQADILLLSHLPSKYAFVFQESGITSHFDAERGTGPLGGASVADYDALLVTDTGTFSQLPGLEEVIKNFPGQVLVIDHHRTQEAWGTARLVESGCSSACELVWRTMRAWGVVPTPEMAKAVYVGLVTDTGWFQFSNATPSTLRLAAELMEAGAVPDEVYQRIYQSEHVERIRLQNRAVSSLELFCNGRLAIMRLSKSDFAATGASVNDTEAAVNLPMAIATVEMSILATEPPEGGAVRISCRSKGKVDVSAFAQQFGGGGHARAAGLKVNGPLDEVVAKITAAAVTAVGE